MLFFILFIFHWPFFCIYNENYNYNYVCRQKIYFKIGVLSRQIHPKLLNFEFEIWKTSVAAWLAHEPCRNWSFQFSNSKFKIQNSKALGEFGATKLQFWNIITIIIPKKNYTNNLFANFFIFHLFIFLIYFWISKFSFSIFFHFFILSFFIFSFVSCVSFFIISLFHFFHLSFSKNVCGSTFSAGRTRAHVTNTSQFQFRAAARGLALCPWYHPAWVSVGTPVGPGKDTHGTLGPDQREGRGWPEHSSAQQYSAETPQTW